LSSSIVLEFIESTEFIMRLIPSKIVFCYIIDLKRLQFSVLL